MHWEWGDDVEEGARHGMNGSRLLLKTELTVPNTGGRTDKIILNST